MKIEIEVPQSREAEIRLLVAAWLSGPPAAPCQAASPAAAPVVGAQEEPAADFGGRSYADAVRMLGAAPDVSFALKRRITEDGNRDPLDALNDAEAHLALQALRVRELFGAGR